MLSFYIVLWFVAGDTRRGREGWTHLPAGGESDQTARPRAHTGPLHQGAAVCYGRVR